MNYKYICMFWCSFDFFINYISWKVAYLFLLSTDSEKIEERVSSKIIKEGRINLKLADFCLQIRLVRTNAKKYFLYIWSPNIHGSSFELIKSKLREGYCFIWCFCFRADNNQNLRILDWHYLLFFHLVFSNQNE